MTLHRLCSRLAQHADVLGLLALALVVRAVGLGRDDFWSDEVHTFDAIARSAADLTAERAAAGHQPFYFLALRAWGDLFGVTEAALRWPSVIAGTLAILPARSLLRRIAGPAAGSAAALLLAVHPVFVELSREARMYPFVLFAWCVAADAAVQALDTGRVSWRFWPPLVLGALLHPSWVLGCLPLAVWVGLLEVQRKGASPSPRVTRLLLLGLGFSLVVALVAMSLTTAQHPHMSRRSWPAEIGVYVLRQVSGAGVRRSALIVHAAALLGWFAVSALGWTRLDARARRFTLALLVGVHGLAALAGLLLGTAWGPVRYVQIAVVPVVLLAGAGLAAAVEIDRWLGRLTGAALVGICAVTLFLRFGRAETTWSDAAALHHAGRVASAPTDPGAEVVLRHYLAHPRTRVNPR